MLTRFLFNLQILFLTVSDLFTVTFLVYHYSFISILLKTITSVLPLYLLISAAVWHLRHDSGCSLIKYVILACNKTANVLLHNGVHRLCEDILYLHNVTVQNGSRPYVLCYLQI